MFPHRRCSFVLYLIKVIPLVFFRCNFSHKRLPFALKSKRTKTRSICHRQIWASLPAESIQTWVPYGKIWLAPKSVSIGKNTHIFNRFISDMNDRKRCRSYVHISFIRVQTRTIFWIIRFMMCLLILLQLLVKHSPHAYGIITFINAQKWPFLL